MPNFDDVTIEQLFGAEDAENETPERFKAYFFYNKAYESVIAPLPIRILVGHKGVGKSALLRHAYLADQEQGRLAVWIQPNDLVPRISGVQSKEFNELIEEWKLGLVEAVADTILKDHLDSHLTTEDSGVLKKGARVIVDVIQSHLGKIAKEQLSTAKTNIVERFIQNGNVHVYVDDIDRGWAASKDNIQSISALLNAIRDLAGSQSRMSFRIGLRTDVYFLVRTSDESTDKIERHVIWLDWTNHEILAVMAKRIVTYFGENTSQKDILAMTQKDISQEILSRVIVPRFEGEGHWSRRSIHNVLLSLIRKRPRDLVKLMHAAARNAYKSGNKIISSSNLEQAFVGYSNDRLQDIVNEFRSELPNIEALLLNMRATKKQRRTAESFLFTTDQLTTKLKEVIGHTTLIFSGGRRVSAQSLIQFMYKIDFITARRESPDGRIDRQYFDQSRFLANEFVDFGYDWEIHPAYRWALSPQNIQEVIDSLGK
ncbi:hypothetical protein A7A08_01627 [Methyloligella halotolerans]|uniref:ATP-binding protein n=1 Tax=Methyloligella halotolerans TaxID=1177755 RepID=A0A1E2RZD9_9HYPH|nr:ATP-binding protein [Methyloligella halotolerans]ODA67593.1 hypothetical protein A7A08_01627 [Methyloligella halotolerans]